MDIDDVIKIIDLFKKGYSDVSIKKETGIPQRKIENIISRFIKKRTVRNEVYEILESKMNFI